MSRINYEYLKEIAKKTKAKLAKEGFFIEKTERIVPREAEKEEMLYQMAINRLKKYPPYKKGKAIFLPYFSRKDGN